MSTKYAKQSLRVLAECQQAGVAIARNPRHAVCTDQCQLWFSSRDCACVCLDSGNVHLCGEHCNLPARVSMDNDSMVCPLTHIVLPEKLYTQTSTYDKVGRPIQHWDLYSARKKNRASQPRAKKTCFSIEQAERVISRCFAYGARARQVRVKKAATKIKSLARKLVRPTFFTARRLVNAHVTEVVNQAPQLPRCLAASVCRFLNKNTGLSLGNVDIAVGTMLSLMATGLCVGGATLVERCEFVSRRMPLPNEMGSVQRISCRSMSMGIRLFKDYSLGSDGTPVYNRCFRLSPDERAALFNCAYGSVLN